MNCHDLERMVLLEQSGELPARQRKALTEHLAACADCRTRRDDLIAATVFLSTVTAANGPSGAVVDRIMNAARTRRPARRISVLHPAWVRALAAAAVLALLLGYAGLIVLRSTKANAPAASDTRAAEVSSLLAMLMDLDADATEAHAAAASGDLRGIACQLLILEGLSEDVFEAPADDVTRLEGRQPTTLQWRSNPEVHAGICA